MMGGTIVEHSGLKIKLTICSIAKAKLTLKITRPWDEICKLDKFLKLSVKHH